MALLTGADAHGPRPHRPTRKTRRIPAPGLGLPADITQPRCHHADFLFFLSSSTSVNSASTTSSLGPLPALADSPSAPCPSACLYIASPSFIEAWPSALVLALMASASSPFTASLRSAMAFS